jgi:hypothetical protein
MPGGKRPLEISPSANRALQMIAVAPEFSIM